MQILDGYQFVLVPQMSDVPAFRLICLGETTCARSRAIDSRVEGIHDLIIQMCSSDRRSMQANEQTACLRECCGELFVSESFGSASRWQDI